MDNYEFDIGVESLECIDFTGEFLVSSKKTEEGYYKCGFYEKKPNGEGVYSEEEYYNFAGIRRRIESEFYETLTFIIQSHSSSTAYTMINAEYSIYELKNDRNVYLIASLIGLSTAYPISVGIQMISTEPAKGFALLIGGAIVAIGSMSMFANFQKYVNKIKQSEEEYKAFILDEAKKYIRKK